MANELISFPVAGTTIAIAAGGLGWICRKVRQELAAEKTALMGVLGAFVFAAQMVNFQLPFMPGTSGHLIGAVFLSVILGPYLAAVVLSSVVIIQCLLFQDGGLLALGCNIINIAIIPCFAGYYTYQAISGCSKNRTRLLFAAVIASVIAAESGSLTVVLEATLSGVLRIPVTTFLATMAGVHLLVGVMEGLITLAVLSYIAAVRPDFIPGLESKGAKMNKKAVLISFVIITLITAAGFSLLASSKPDGLEWSYLERPDQPDFKPVAVNENKYIEAADKLQSKIAILPDYSSPAASEEHPAAVRWTSIAGIVGSAACMALLWILAKLLRPKSVSD